eukprot:TRINITY_DN7571_c0_g1_i1.p1 TRINITY_DN7571_c0_g1~~TRINITY_DN7571_c0_g1_i1.p1  ORF type:complete len:124 (+),score=19.34 TRINITY_DN7571_c0_g1_i1:234-605(+)
MPELVVSVAALLSDAATTQQATLAQQQTPVAPSKGRRRSKRLFPPAATIAAVGAGAVESPAAADNETVSPLDPSPGMEDGETRRRKRLEKNREAAHQFRMRQRAYVADLVQAPLRCVFSLAIS